MKILVLKEKDNQEKRVALVPEIVSKYIKLGFQVFVEKGAGLEINVSDKDYENSGAEIIGDISSILGNVDIILSVQGPKYEEIEKFSACKKNVALVAMLNPYQISSETVKLFQNLQIKAFAVELFPRISRAQLVDVLSSQSNLAGYRAVIEAAYHLKTAMPMMMTSAGTITPTKIMVLGAGVAGLQAIATSKRLGAVVCAFDVRPATKEQVQSLGAKFIDVASSFEGEDSSGYAKETSENYQNQQEKAIFEHIINQDAVICTALIPGKEAPKLITENMLKKMKEGSVIVDLAAVNGGNCAGTEPDKIVDKFGVKIIGYKNFASKIAKDASKLYSRNLYNFVEMLTNQEKKIIEINLEDEIIKSSLIS